MSPQTFWRRLPLPAMLLAVWPAAGHSTPSAFAPSSQGREEARLAAHEQRVSAASLTSSAIQALQRALAGRAQRFEFLATQKVPDLLVAGHNLALRSRPLPAALPLARRMAVWVDVCEGDQTRRSVLVPIEVRAYQTGWVAVRDLPAGSRLLLELLRESEVEITQRGHAAWQGNPSGYVARLMVPAGTFLTHATVGTLPAVQRGDRVQMMLRQGGVRVQAEAHALQDAQLGQSLQVRMSGSFGQVLARVVEPGKVEVIQ